MQDDVLPGGVQVYAGETSENVKMLMLCLL
jgi:hypothetical protein